LIHMQHQDSPELLGAWKDANFSGNCCEWHRNLPMRLSFDKL
jgi:hypothetical protein